MITSEQDINIIEKNIDRMHGELTEKEIIIFGCTPQARVIYDRLRGYGLEISAVIDNNSAKAGTACMRVPVCCPEELLVPYDLNKIIIVCSKYSNEMIAQLGSLGYGAEQIVNIEISENYTSNTDKEEEFLQAQTDVIKGIEIYERLTVERKFLFLCPYPGTGDVYMACAYLPEYLKIADIKHYKLIVLTQGCARVAGLFGITEVSVISEIEKNLLLKAWEFLGTDKIQTKPLLHWGWRTKRYIYSDHHKQITFTEMFKYDVFGLPEQAKISVPCRQKVADELWKVIDCYRIEKGRTVIISPYAGSFISDISLRLWEKIVSNLQTRGFFVCTNVSGKEQAIHGTVPVSFSYEIARELIEYAGFFVAVRSGLCDIVSSAESKILVIYEEGFNASSIDYFGLKNMGLNKAAKEYVYCGDDNELERFVIEEIRNDRD